MVPKRDDKTARRRKELEDLLEHMSLGTLQGHEQFEDDELEYLIQGLRRGEELEQLMDQLRSGEWTSPAE
jgi:hypothetical protein